MNNENNVNATQNPNVTNTSQNTNPIAQPAAQSAVQPAAQSAGQSTVQPVVQPVPEAAHETTETNNLQTIVVPSDFPEEAPAVAAAAETNMPTVVNPLEVKVEEPKPEVKVEEKPVAPEGEQPEKQEKISEYQEKLRKAQENYKPPSNFQMALTIFMFVMIIVFIIFLPDIVENVERLKAGPQTGPAPDPTTGTLVCTLENNTSNLDKKFTRKFSYEENKLKSAVIETSTRGDITLDETLLDDLYNKCVSISKGVEYVDGVNVVCEYKDGLLVERERFDYKTFDVEATNAAYTEAGSSVLEFDYDSNIDEIMKSMRQAGFTCNKEK